MMMTFSDMFYEQLKKDNFFCPQNDLYAWKTEDTLKSGPDSLLLFQQPTIQSAPLK